MTGNNNKITMPYLLQNGQNRVENIKKKFENSYLDGKEDGNLLYKDNKSFNSQYKTRGVQSLKSGNLENENDSREKFRLQNDKYLGKSDINRGDGKAVVRRSPAFRREKVSYGKNAKSLSDINAKFSSNQKLTERTKVLFNKDNHPDDASALKIKNGIIRNNTEPNLFHLPESTRPDNYDNVCSDLFAKSTELENKEKDKNSKNIINDKITVQYSPNNNSGTSDKSMTNAKNGLKITDSIRLALKAPLPKGPPPKKPPRTFLHTMNAADICTNSQDSSTVLAKDDPILRLKLKKIEKAIKGLDHRTETNVSCNNNKVELARPPVKVNSSPKAVSGKSADVFCFKSFKCIGSEGYEKPFMCNKESEKQSSFYVDCDGDQKDNNKTDLKTPDNGKSLLLLPKRCNFEHIYDLPCVNKKNSFESFGKGFREGEIISNTPQHLHYMCTDVVNSIQDGKSPIFLPLNQDERIGSNIHTEADNDKIQNTFCKSQTSQKNCQELVLTDVKEKNEIFEEGKKKIATDEMKIPTNDICNTLNYNFKCIKSNPSNLDIDSGSVSVSYGLEDSYSNTAENNQTVHNRKKQDDRCAAPLSNTGDDLMSQTTASRKTYVKRVSSKILTQSPFAKGLNNESYDHLFESCILVGLTLAESKTTAPYIKSIFPPNVIPPPLIEHLCFPDASTWSQGSCNLQQGEQYYSLVITNENGFRKFGYCRRVLPEGGNFCLPLVYCIISPHRANGFYYKVLQELESRHGSSELQAFIKQLYECKFPGPGRSLKFKKILEEVTRVSPVKVNECLPTTLVRRPHDVRLEERDLSQLLQHLKVSVLLKVFSSLLLERKVLLLGHSLRNLSYCIEALQSLLIPFSWQHTFIPVLPNTLNDMCDAPTPYIIGLQKSTCSDDFLSNLNFEDGIMVDLEESHIIKCCGDEGSIIPQRLIKGLKTALNSAVNVSLKSDNDRNVLISEAFIRFFVEICGNYSCFIVKQTSGKRIFQKEEFLSSMPGIQSFLDWFLDTAMFRSFMQERLQNDIEDLFKRRAAEYYDEIDKNKALVSKNSVGVNRKVRSLGERIKDLKFI